MKTIKLDKERSILFDFNAFEMFEELSDKSYQSFNFKSAKETKILIFSALKNADPETDVTLDIVGKHLTGDLIADVSEAFVEALLGKEANSKMGDIMEKIEENNKK